MKHTTGTKLILLERQEQLQKHGRTIENDVKHNGDNQLAHAAEGLISKDWTYIMGDDDFYETIPKDWDAHIWMKMYRKPYKERLIIAGALIAAEIDRLIALENAQG